MGKSVYPYQHDDLGLRTCARCRSRVYHTAMCEKHPGDCLTCCGRLKRVCELIEEGLRRQRAAGECAGKTSATYEQIHGMPLLPDMTDEEREAERAAVAKIVESLYGP